MTSILRVSFAIAVLFFSVPCQAQGGSTPSRNECILDLMAEINVVQKNNINEEFHGWTRLAKDKLAAGLITPEMAKAIEGADKIRPFFSSKMIYPIIADELSARGFTTPKDIRSVLTSFATLLPEKDQLNLVDGIVQRMVATLPSEARLDNFKQVTDLAKRMHMSIEDFTRFIHQWNQLKDSNFDDAALAIYMNLLESSGAKLRLQGMSVGSVVSSQKLIDEVAKQKSFVNGFKRRWLQLIRNEYAPYSHYAPVPLPSLNSSHLDFSPSALAKGNYAWGPANWDELRHFLEKANSNHIEYYVNRIYMQMSKGQLEYVLETLQPSNVSKKFLSNLRTRHQFLTRVLELDTEIDKTKSALADLEEKLRKLPAQSKETEDTAAAIEKNKAALEKTSAERKQFIEKKRVLDQLNAPSFSDGEAATPAASRKQTEQH